MRKILLYLCIIITAFVSSCSSQSGFEDVERPGSNKPKPSPELEDASMRLVSPMLRLDYNDGGILFSISDAGVISGVRLKDESRFEYDPAKPSLSINGRDYQLEEAAVVKNEGAVCWHRIVISESKAEVFVVFENL